MNENDQELLEGLRELASDGQPGAPVRIEERLLHEFRRRVRVRRRIMLASSAGAVAIAAGLFIMMRVAPATHAPATQNAAVAAMIAETPGIIEVPSPSEDAGMNFYELPDARELPPVENATVVRVELPVASLRSIGFQVNEESANAAVEADVLLGQDGLARGVRFIE